MNTSGMIAELARVPKPALQTVFGKGLGRRIWHQNQQSETKADVADTEIVAGMLEYLGSRAAEALRQQDRQARAIGLRIVYANGRSEIDRMRLARPTNDSAELVAAAKELFSRSERRSVALGLLDLRLTSLASECVSEHANGLQPAMANAAM